MGFIYTLVSGNHSLCISEGQRGDEGKIGVQASTVRFPSGAKECSLGLLFYLGTQGRLAVLRRLIGQVRQYLEWAEAYQRHERTDPVELWVQPEDGCELVPTFGDVVRRRRITGGKLEAPQGISELAYDADVVPQYKLNLECEPFWRAPMHWMMCASGGLIEDKSDGGLEVWQGTTNLCQYPSSYLGWINELIQNSGFETVGSGGADVFAVWSETAGDGTIARTTTAGEFYAGAAAAKLTAGTTRNTKVSQTITVNPGWVYYLSFWTRTGDAAAAGQYGVYDVTHSVDIIAKTSTGIASTTYTQKTVTFTVPAGCTSVRLDLWCPDTNAKWAAFDEVSIQQVAQVGDYEEWCRLVYGELPAGIHGVWVWMRGAGTSYLFRDEVTGAPLAQLPYTLAVTVKGAGSTIGKTFTLTLEERGGAAAAASTSQTVTLTDDWQQVSVTRTIAQADRTTLRIQMSIAGLAAEDMWFFTNAQLEQRSYATPFVDGYSGLGCRWTGTALASSSTRQAAVLWGSSYSIVKPARGMLSIWVRDVDWDAGRARYLFDCGVGNASNRIRLYITAGNALTLSIFDLAGNENTVSVAAGAYTDASWYHIVAQWTRNNMRLYVNGAEVGSADTSCDMPSELDGRFFLGSDRSGANQLNATIGNDFRIYDVTPTATQVSALYNAGRGPGLLPYIGALAEGVETDTPGVLIQQHEDGDAGHQNWVQIGNVPGDLPAPLWWQARFGTEPVGPVRMACLYYGLRSHDGEHCQFNFDGYHAEALDGDTTKVADANCAFGYKARISASVNGAWGDRMSWTVLSGFPAQVLRRMKGRWRVYARVYDGAAATGIHHLRARPGLNSVVRWFPNDTGVTAPAVGRWTWVEIGEVELPLMDAGNENVGTAIQIGHMRDSGTSTLDIDYITLVPVEYIGRLGRPGGNYTIGFSAVEQNGIADEPYNAPLYVETMVGPDIEEPLQEAIGDFVQVTPGETARLVLACVAHTTTYEHLLTADYQMSVAARIEPRYSLPW